MAAAVQSGLAFAATWQTPEGAIVGYTFGGTVCWFPRVPGRLRIAREDFETIPRCRECPGCLELDRRRLADRLVAKYYSLPGGTAGKGGAAPASSAAASATSAATLFLVRCYVPLDQHAALSHRLHRIRGLELEPGFWRLGTSSVALLCRVASPLRRWLRYKRIAFRIQALKLRRGRRAFRALTAGVLIPREKYGEQRNRWYARGLPQLAREKWEVVKREYQKGYQRATSPRAWKAGRVVLIPPEAWRLRRVDRVALRRALSRVSSPEEVRSVADLAASLASARSLDSLLTASPHLLPSREQVEEFYGQMRSRKGRRERERATDNSSLSPSEGGAYTSSVHSTEAPRAGPASDEELLALGPGGKPRWMEREDSQRVELSERERERRERSRRGLAEALERLRQKLTRGKS